MPKDQECKHVPDPKTVSYGYHDDESEYTVVDFNCADCGISGSTVIQYSDINWD